jgi:hypothetical protein
VIIGGVTPVEHQHVVVGVDAQAATTSHRDSGTLNKDSDQEGPAVGNYKTYSYRFDTPDRGFYR